MKLFLFLRSSFIFGYTISSIFLSFYIFQYTKSFNQAILFNIIFFAATPIGANIAAIICKKISCNIGNFIGVIIYLISMLLVLISPSLVVNNLVIFGVISGLGQGFYFLSINVITQYISNQNDREEINGMLVTVSNIATIIFPLFSSFIVYYTKSYFLVFLTAAIFFLTSAILILTLKIDYPKSKLKIISFLKLLSSDRDIVISYQTVLYNGIFWAIRMVILPLLVLSVLTNIAAWGIFNTALCIFSIILAQVYSRIANMDNEKIFFVLTSAVYAIAGLFLSSYYNNYLFLIYTFLTAVINVVMDITYPSTLQDIIDEYDNMKDFVIEYQVINQYVYAMTEVGILLAIYILHIPILNSSSVSISFMFITLIPLLMGILLSKTKIMNQRSFTD